MWTNVHRDEFVRDECVGDELLGDESTGSPGAHIIFSKNFAASEKKK